MGLTSQLRSLLTALLALCVLTPAWSQGDPEQARAHYTRCAELLEADRVCAARRACEQAVRADPLDFIKDTLRDARAQCERVHAARDASAALLTRGALAGASRACPEGLQSSPDTAGHCCWPGQAWNGERCKGLPTSCPEGLVPLEEICALPDCPEGQERVDGAHCCWADQAWSRSASRCVGLPRCPEGTFAEGDDCLIGSPIDRAPMIRISAGRFLMGTSDEERDAALAICRETYANPELCSASNYSAEPEQTSVWQDGFQLDVYEVTNARYEACVKDGGCAPRDTSACQLRPVSFGPGRWGEERGPIDPAWLASDLPATCVSHPDAAAYCAWAGKRLPTEREWERAARGTSGALFPWGEAWAVERLERPDAPRPVDQLDDRSPEGALGLATNVSEWTAGAFEHAGDAPLCAVRGGHFRAGTDLLRGAWRGGESPETRSETLGFRCARDLP